TVGLLEPAPPANLLDADPVGVVGLRQPETGRIQWKGPLRPQLQTASCSVRQPQTSRAAPRDLYVQMRSCPDLDAEHGTRRVDQVEVLPFFVRLTKGADEFGHHVWHRTARDPAGFERRRFTRC